MRLSTDAERDETRARATILAAVDAGVTVFDTARSYGQGEHELGHNERLLASALREGGAAEHARIVTKGGMGRAGGAWIPDGRAKTLRADCEASLEDLGGLPIDLYLVHVPDPRTPWRTTVRALARLAEDGLVRRVGLANVSRRQLDEALALAPVAAVQVALSPWDDRALRGGVVERCEELDLALIAHSPLGGPRRAGRLGRIEALAGVAVARGATPAEAGLAWLLGLSPALVAIPGARRPDTARSAARAASLRLAGADHEAISQALGTGSRGVAVVGASPDVTREVVVVMGIPGAGKSQVAEEYVGRGSLRLNRDERGGTLRDLAEALDSALAAGVRQVVLDNTYLTRASRSYVLEAARRHGAPVRCVWLDTPLAAAQVNMVGRVLERLGTLPEPEELRGLARREPGLLAPTSQMRALRELEPPAADEGWASIEQLGFERRPADGGAGLFVAAAALARPGWETAVAEAPPGTPSLLFDWRPGGSAAELEPAAARLAHVTAGSVETAVCTHGGGPPACWCRPPLPGLPLAFARVQSVDPARSLLIATSSAHLALAAALGSRPLRL